MDPLSEREHYWITEIRKILNPTLDLPPADPHPYHAFHLKAIRILNDDELEDALNSVREVATSIENPSAWFGGALKNKAASRGRQLGRGKDATSPPA